MFRLKSFLAGLLLCTAAVAGEVDLAVTTQPSAGVCDEIDVAVTAYADVPTVMGAIEIVLGYDPGKLGYMEDVDTESYAWQSTFYPNDACQWWHCDGWNISKVDGNFWFRLMPPTTGWPVATTGGNLLAKFKFKVLATSGMATVELLTVGAVPPDNTVLPTAFHTTTIYDGQEMNSVSILGAVTPAVIDLGPEVPEGFRLGADRNGDGSANEADAQVP